MSNKKIGLYLVLLTCFLLPFDKVFGSIAIGLTFLFSIFRIVREKRYNEILSVAFFSCVTLYLVYIVGMFYTTNVKYGFSFLSSKVSFLLFPIIFLGIKTSKREIIQIFIVFVFSYSCRCIYFLSSFLPKIIGDGFEKKWSFQEVYANGGFHPTYMSLYSIISIIILIYFIRNSLKKKISLFLIFFHVCVIYLLASRIAIITLLVVVIIFSIFLALKRRKLRKQIIITGVISILILPLGVLINKDFKYKFLQLKSINNFEYNKYDASSISTRIAKWQSAIEISKENILLGSGTGDLPDELIKQFKKIDCLQCKVKKYNNPHNQYLDSLSRNGVLGLLALIFLLGYPLVVAIKRKNIYMLLISVTFCIMLIPECILNVEKGVEIFCFFNSLFLFNLIKND